MTSVQARTFEPSSAEELAEIVRATAGEGLTLRPVGAGTHLACGNSSTRPEAVIWTAGINRIVEYSPEDQVVVVEAGTTLRALEETLAPNRQRLALDPPGGGRRTIGGAIATNAYGPSRLRFGTLKDLIVGIEFVRADGALVHAGGKVVKNVAGFDLPKLMVGALGTLGIVTKATFRVHPTAESRGSLVLQAASDAIFPLVLALRETQLEPTSILTEWSAASSTVEIVFEGFAAGVEAQLASARAVAGRLGLDETSPLAGAEDLGGLALRATFAPSELAVALQRAGAPAARRGARLRTLPSLGVIRVDAPPEVDARALVVELRAHFEELGGTLVVERWHPAALPDVDAWGTPPPSFPLMVALKERFDPERRLNPGRYLGGL